MLTLRLGVAGRDATVEFETMRHSSAALVQMEKLFASWQHLSPALGGYLQNTEVASSSSRLLPVADAIRIPFCLGIPFQVGICDSAKTSESSEPAKPLQLTGGRQSSRLKINQVPRLLHV